MQLLPPSVCLSLITELETGCSAHSSVQAAADQLVALCCNRLGALLAEAPALLPAQIQLHAAVLSYLGPLHCMLRDDARRQLFAKLPFWMLRVRWVGAAGDRYQAPALCASLNAAGRLLDEQALLRISGDMPFAATCSGDISHVLLCRCCRTAFWAGQL